MKRFATIFIFSRLKKNAVTLKPVEKLNYLLCRTNVLLLCVLEPELAFSETNWSVFPIVAASSYCSLISHGEGKVDKLGDGSAGSEVLYVGNVIENELSK